MSTERREAASDSPYTLPNVGQQAPQRFSALAALYDPATIDYLERCGVTTGWRCLEVGGGGGSVARWLADRVGPTGHVLVTDIDTRFLDPLAGPTVEVRRHDIETEALPEAEFDLVHTRLVLHHLPERDQALRRMVAALRPGGWIVVEEFDWSSMNPDPTDAASAAAIRTVLHPIWRFMTERGADSTFARRLWRLLREHQLEQVTAEGRVTMYQGGSPGAEFLLAGVDQLQEALLAMGWVTDQDIDAYCAVLTDPNFALMSPVMMTAWGRRPTR